jgi:hypothetical protein
MRMVPVRGFEPGPVAEKRSRRRRRSPVASVFFENSIRPSRVATPSNSITKSPFASRCSRHQRASASNRSWAFIEQDDLHDALGTAPRTPRRRALGLLQSRPTHDPRTRAVPPVLQGSTRRRSPIPRLRLRLANPWARPGPTARSSLGLFACASPSILQLFADAATRRRQNERLIQETHLCQPSLSTLNI